MKRRAAFLFTFLLFSTAAAPLPARAGWAEDLFKSGSQDIQQGKKNGNPMQVLGGYIERGIGALFGGKPKNGEPPPPAPPQKGEEKGGGSKKPSETPPGGHSGHSDPAHTSGSSTGGSSAGPMGGGSGPAAPQSGATPPAPGKDSTSLIKKDEPAPMGRADDPVMTSQLGSTKQSTDGGLAGVRNAFGRALRSGGMGTEASAEAPHPDELARQGLAADEARKAAEAKDKALLGKTVAQIGGVGGVDAEIKRQASELVAAARTKIAMGDFQGAIDDLTRAITLDPTNAQAWARRAEAYNRLRRWDAARTDALKAVELDPQSSLAWEQLAYAEYKLGNLDAALKAINEAIRLNPDNGTLYAIRAMIKQKLGDTAGALADMEMAARLSPKFRDAWERARERGKVVDPDEESSLGDDLGRVALGMPFWLWAVLGAFACVFATGGVVVVLRKPRSRALPTGSLARPIMTGDAQAEGRLGGKYEVRALIGKGGMGNVYEALDHSLGRSVAVKKMSENLADMAPQAREMLIKEAKTVAQLHHPAIVDIYELIQDGNDMYLVFELVSGKTANQVLAESGRLPLARCLEILRPVCQALEFAHGREMVHRDLKPSNIMITEDGSVKLMDFGIARSLADKTPERSDGVSFRAPALAAAAPQTAAQNQLFARTQTVVGTPLYMAPEMEQGVVAKQGDVYALGVCLYEMTTGRVPCATLMEKAAMSFAKPSAVDPKLALIDDLVWAALQPDPSRRLPSAKDFLAALEAAAKAA